MAGGGDTSPSRRQAPLCRLTVGLTTGWSYGGTQGGKLGRGAIEPPNRPSLCSLLCVLVCCGKLVVGRYVGGLTVGVFVFV